MPDPKRVVSVSLGSSKRNKVHEVEVLGVPFRIERIGTDGDLEAFSRMFSDLDGHVDALGIGGADRVVVIGKREYVFRQIDKLVAGAKKTPVVDGSGLKHTLERESIEWLQRSGTVDFKKERVLLVSAVDRYGMAQALSEKCRDVVYGDLLFGIGLPIPLRSYKAVERLGALVLPLISQLPFKWFYPTGEKQESRTPKFPGVFQEATFLCGDWLFLRRYMPDSIEGKTVLTQTLRKDDIALLRQMKAARVITTTPLMGGETFATNVMEGVLVTLLGKPPRELRPQDYVKVLSELGWTPNLIDLGGA